MNVLVNKETCDQEFFLEQKENFINYTAVAPCALSWYLVEIVSLVFAQLLCSQLEHLS